MRLRRSQSILLVLAVLLAGCAVQHAPQIKPETQLELNLGYALDQASSDYRTFFRDVGQAKRESRLSEAQVASLNKIGVRLEMVLETANRTYQTYLASKDQALEQQIVAYIAEAAQIFSELVKDRAAMLAGGGP